MSVDDCDIEHFVRMFALLSDPARLRIVSFLLQTDGDDGVSASEIADAIGLATGAAAALLAPLLSAGMVGYRDDVPAPRYFVTDQRLGPVCDLVCSGLRNPAAAGPRAATIP